MIGRFSQRADLWVNTFIVALSQGLSGLMGLSTQILAARLIGVGEVTDGFFVVYVLADSIGGIFFSLALLVLVPRILEHGRLTSQGRALCWMFGLVSAALITVVATVIWIFASQLVSLLAPNLTANGLLTADKTLRIVAPLIVLNCVGAIAMATLQAVQKFIAASISKILFALGPFLAALLVMETHGIQVLAWAALAGGLLSTSYLWFAVARLLGVPTFVELVHAKAAVTGVASGLLPVAVARSSTELWWMVIRALATGIPGGATLLVIAQRLASALHLIGNSIGSVAYPDIVREISSGPRALMKITRVRCDQCLAWMSVLAWPMAGVADELVWVMTQNTARDMNTGIHGGALCVGLFLLTVPWATVNGMLGNTTWALRFVWRRLFLQLAAMTAVAPIMWISVRLFGIVAIPGGLLLETLLLLTGGELLLRKVTGYPMIHRALLNRWLFLGLVGTLSMTLAWWISSVGRLVAGEHLGLRVTCMLFAMFAGCLFAGVFVAKGMKDTLNPSPPAVTGLSEELEEPLIDKAATYSPIAIDSQDESRPSR